MSLPFRLGSSSMLARLDEETAEPKRIVFLSVEGTKTEVSYFRYIEKFRENLGIKKIVHIEVLEKNDTKSDPNNVLELLEEYVQFRESGTFQDEVASLDLKNYDTQFIRTYLNNSLNIPARQRNKFENVLRKERLNLLYLNFLSKYHGENDAFGIVIDRDCDSHSIKQMNEIMATCKQKGYHCFVTNPCFEFWQLLHVSDVVKEYEEYHDRFLANEKDARGNTFVSNLLYDKTHQRKALPLKAFVEFYLPNIDLAIARAKDFASDGELIDKIGTNLGDLFDLMRKD